MSKKLQHQVDEDSVFEGVCGLFPNLKPEEREKMRNNFSCMFVPKGKIIYREGDTPPGLVCLSKGIVKLYKEGVGGRDQIVRMAKPVGFMGYRALFADENYTATAQALEDSVVSIIERNALTEILRNNAELTLHILKSVASELGFSTNRTVTLTQKHVRGRVAESLIFLRDTYGFEDDGVTLKAYLSREDMANLSNMTTSNAIRTLSSFAEEGIIELDGRRIKILDQYKLERVSNLG